MVTVAVVAVAAAVVDRVSSDFSFAATVSRARGEAAVEDEEGGRRGGEVSFDSFAKAEKLVNAF